MNTQTLTPEMQLYLGLAFAASVLIIAIFMSRRRGIEVLAHRGFFVLPEADNTEKASPPQDPHWFVKIFNHGTKPVVITHVSGRKCVSDYVALLAKRLPARIEPGGVIETWISEDEIGGDPSQRELAGRFQAIDTAGRIYKGRLNVNVAPAGHVA